MIAKKNEVKSNNCFKDPVTQKFVIGPSFTSLDESSFTAESTKDSFSDVDYADSCNIDAIQSSFNKLYPPEYSCNFVSCRKVTMLGLSLS